MTPHILIGTVDCSCGWQGSGGELLEHVREPKRPIFACSHPALRSIPDPDVIAWYEWKRTPEAQGCLEGSPTGVYLEHRLWTAFIAARGRK